MLAQLLEPFAHSHRISDKIFEFGHRIEEAGERVRDFVHDHKIDQVGQRIMDFLNDDPNALPDGATSKFAAGFLYGASNEKIDKREYILGCTKESDMVKAELKAAFDAYNQKTDKKNKEGNQHIRKAEPQWKDDMGLCYETNIFFHRVDKELDDFFVLPNWVEYWESNYKANKDYVDKQWASCLSSWNQAEQDHFAAGQHYANTLFKLTGVEAVMP